MLKVKSPSAVHSSKRAKVQEKLLDALEDQKYKIECYKAWIKALAPKESYAIIQEVEERVSERG